MAFTVNKQLLLGHVGRDPEIKSTTGGTLVATFSLATTERYKKDRSENFVEHTEWHNLVAYSRTAEIVRDYVKKGSKLHIEGRTRTRSWDDKDTGKKVYRTEVIITELGLLGGRSSEGRSNGNDNHNASPANSNNGGNPDAEPAYDGDGAGVSEPPF